MPSIRSTINNNSFDVIVIGVGSMGSSACYYLAKEGYHVLGLEQFDITHELGSHTGQSRIIRKAYFEDPGYVPMLNKAYEGWKALEEESGKQLYYRTGLVYFGQPANLLIKGTKQSASLYNIPLEKMDSAGSSKRFPQFKIPLDFETLFEPDAGFVLPEISIRLYAELAGKQGAVIHTQEKVTSWEKDGEGISVKTTANSYRCDKLIITAGAWSGKMIPGFSQTIKVTRQFVAWIKTRPGNDYSLNNFPCWMIADDKRPGAYYGFPVLPSAKFGEPEGLKLAWHFPAAITDADTVQRKTTVEDEESIQYVLDKYFPGAFHSFIASKICLYANSPDENFIIDHLPGHENVVVACGFSGHGFKFVPAVGKILAELAIQGKTGQPISFLSATRFANK